VNPQPFSGETLSLWTPSGEHRVDPATKDAPTTTPATGAPAEDDGPSLEDLTPEQRAQVEEMNRQMEAARVNRQMEAARARMLQLPAGSVIGQQALQFYELAAIYLSEDPPRLVDARLAIDALAAIIERLGSGLGEAEQPLRQALHQLQMAFVEATRAVEASGSAGQPG
jgi:hypothetical protein